MQCCSINCHSRQTFSKLAIWTCAFVDILFITRLPENFGACTKLIGTAVADTGSWQDVGKLSCRVVRGKNICASYRIQETTVDLCEKTYRALIVHSDAHDKRRRKRIAKAVEKDKATLDFFS